MYTPIPCAQKPTSSSILLLHIPHPPHPKLRQSPRMAGADSRAAVVWRAAGPLPAEVRYECMEMGMETDTDNGKGTGTNMGGRDTEASRPCIRQQAQGWSMPCTLVRYKSNLVTPLSFSRALWYVHHRLAGADHVDGKSRRRGHLRTQPLSTNGPSHRYTRFTVP